MEIGIRYVASVLVLLLFVGTASAAKDTYSIDWHLQRIYGDLDLVVADHPDLNADAIAILWHLDGNASNRAVVVACYQEAESLVEKAKAQQENLEIHRRLLERLQSESCKPVCKALDAAQIDYSRYAGGSRLLVVGVPASKALRTVYPNFYVWPKVESALLNGKWLIHCAQWDEPHNREIATTKELIDFLISVGGKMR